ncbi:MAG: hypothetical protein AAB215_09600, partial [Planctomycetota bacterium]
VGFGTDGTGVRLAGASAPKAHEAFRWIDAFARRPGDPSEWRTLEGRWSVRRPLNPSAVNAAFSFEGTSSEAGKRALAAVGTGNPAGCLVEVSFFLPDESAAAGVAACVRPGGVPIVARAAGRTAAAGAGRIEILAIEGGAERSLASVESPALRAR